MNHEISRCCFFSDPKPRPWYLGPWYLVPWYLGTLVPVVPVHVRMYRTCVWLRAVAGASQPGSRPWPWDTRCGRWSPAPPLGSIVIAGRRRAMTGPMTHHMREPTALLVCEYGRGWPLDIRKDHWSSAYSRIGTQTLRATILDRILDHSANQKNRLGFSAS